MKELSLHLLDIAENSISAHAKKIILEVSEDTKTDLLQIKIKDDGIGMDTETAAKLIDPFFTSRTTRRVGLGIPLLKAAAEDCNGNLEIQSSPNQGTTVRVVFQRSHIDRMPLGDLAGTFLTLLVGSPEIHWVMHYAVNAEVFDLDSQEIQFQLGDIPFTDPIVMKWLREYLQDSILGLQID